MAVRFADAEAGIHSNADAATVKTVLQMNCEHNQIREVSESPHVWIDAPASIKVCSVCNLEYQGNVPHLEGEDRMSQSTVYINGLPYPVKGEGNDRYV